MSNVEASVDVLYRVRMCYDFEPTNDDELQVSEGDIISVTKVLDGWSIGVKSDGSIGYFPTEFAERLPEEEDTLTDTSESSGTATSPFVPKYSEQEAVHKIVIYYRCFRFRKQAAKFLKKVRDRINLVKELVHSEQNYVEYLRTMKDLYINPLRERIKNKKKMLTETEISTLFGNLEPIFELALQMLDEITKASSDSTKDLSEVFLRILPFLKLYVVYVQNYEKAVALMTEKNKKDKEFSAFLKNARLDPRCKGLELRDLISKPFQRIFAYKNIFNRMLELTPHESSSYAKLETLDKQMEELVKFINESKRQHENQQKLTQRIDTRMQNLLLKRWRKYVREGRLRITYPIGSETEIWVDCFLANDIFFFIKDNELKTMYICLTEVRDAGDLSIDLNSYPKEVNSCTLKCSDDQEKKDWLDDLLRCKDLEKKFASDQGLQLGIDELLQKWISVLKTTEERRREMEVYKEKLSSNKQQLRSVNKLIDDLRKDIKEGLSKLAKHSAERAQISDARSSLREEQTACFVKMRESLESGYSTKLLFESLFRGETDAFSTVFGNTYNMFTEHQEYFKKFSELDTKKMEPISSDQIVDFAPTIVNQELKEEFAKLRFDHVRELGDLSDLIQKVDYDEQIFELVSQTLDLQHKLVVAQNRNKMLEQSKLAVSTKLQKSEKTLLELHNTYINQVSSRKLDTVSALFEDAVKRVPTTKSDEKFLVQSHIDSAKEISELKEEKAKLQEELRRRELSTKELEEKLAALEQRLEASIKPQNVAETVVATADDKPDKEKARPAAPSRNTKPPSQSVRLEKLVQQKDKQIQMFQDEIAFLTQRIDSIREDKNREIDSLIKKMDCITHLQNAQTQMDKVVSENLKHRNDELNKQIDTLTSIILNNETRIGQLYQQLIEENESTLQASATMERYLADYEKTRASLLVLQYKLVKTEMVFNENEKLKRKLEEQKSTYESMQALNKDLEAQLKQMETELRQSQTSNEKNTGRSRHYSMVTLTHNIPSPPSTQTASNSTSPLPSSSGRPLPVPQKSRKMSGGEKQLLQDIASLTEPHKPIPSPPQLQSSPHQKAISPNRTLTINTSEKASPNTTSRSVPTPTAQTPTEDKEKPVSKIVSGLNLQSDLEREMEKRKKRSDSTSVETARKVRTTSVIPNAALRRSSVPVKQDPTSSSSSPSSDSGTTADKKRASMAPQPIISTGGGFTSILEEMKKRRQMNS